MLLLLLLLLLLHVELLHILRLLYRLLGHFFVNLVDRLGVVVLSSRHPVQFLSNASSQSDHSRQITLKNNSQNVLALIHRWRWLLYSHQREGQLTCLNSMTSCSINRTLDEVLRCFTIFSICWKYWSILGWNEFDMAVMCTIFRPIDSSLWRRQFVEFQCKVKTPTLAFTWSNSLPTVVTNRHRHSKLSSSLLRSSLSKQSCMMPSVSIFSLNNSPMNLKKGKQHQFSELTKQPPPVSPTYKH